MSKRLSTTIMLLFTAICLAVCRVAYAAQEEVSQSHAIAIAYDNSGSMYMIDNTDMYTDRWSYAKYSMEVLASMLGEQDSLVIYAMDEDAPKVSLTGSVPMAERVRAIHQKGFGPKGEDGSYYDLWTFIDPVKEALDFLENSDADSKTLVVMTDGVFNDSRNYPVAEGEYKQQVEEWVSDASASGITTFYLGIGEDASLIDSNEASDVYVRETTSETILDTVTDIANMSFGRSALPGTYMEKTSDSITFDFDVPMSKIVVLAQGSQVSLGGLEGDDGTDQGTKSDVSWSAVGPGEQEALAAGKANKSLHGQVAVFDANRARGSYTLSTTGADSVAVYYMPWVDIATDLVDDEGTVTRLTPGETTDVEAGDYTSSMKLLDPTTGEQLKSALLDGAEMSLTLTQNGEESLIQNGSDERFGLEAGTVDMEATATVPGGVRVNQSYGTLTVEPPLAGLEIDTSGVPNSVRYDEEGTPDGNPEGELHVRKSDGTEFTAEEWDQTELVAYCPEGVEWEVTKSKENPGTFHVRLKHSGDDPSLLDKLGMHLLPFVTNGPTRTTTFTAKSRSDLFNLGGKGTSPVTLSGAFLWWVWLIIAAVLLYLVAWLRKPRLPRINPWIDFHGAAGLGKVEVIANVQIETPFLSLAPERAHFFLEIDEKTLDFVQNQVGFDKIELVASKRGRFMLGEETVSILKEMREHSSRITGGIDEQGKPELMQANGYVEIQSGAGIFATRSTIYFSDPSQNV